jgi:hypothetical protein
MTAIFNTDLVDLLVAPGVSQFTTFEAPDLTELHPEATHWLANHFLNTLIGSQFKDKYRQWAFNQLFRAEVAFRDYHEARIITSEVLVNSQPGRPAIRTYFKAIARWESCLLNVQIFIDVLNKMKRELGDEPVFTENDGSREERAYSMANRIKHWGSDVAAGRHEEHHTIPVWLSNDGLTSSTHKLPYGELASIVSDVASAANALQDPKAFGATQ